MTPFFSPPCALLEAGAAELAGDRPGALRLLRHALDLAVEHDLRTHAACARQRLGALLDGDEGAALRREAAAWMAAEGVVDTTRFVQAHAPGFAGAPQA